MKTLKTMQLNPLDHEYVLSCDIDPELEDFAMVHAKLGDSKAEFAIDSRDAAAIGKWFTKLSEVLKK